MPSFFAFRALLVCVLGVRRFLVHSGVRKVGVKFFGMECFVCVGGLYIVADSLLLFLAFFL